MNFLEMAERLAVYLETRATPSVSRKAIELELRAAASGALRDAADIAYVEQNERVLVARLRDRADRIERGEDEKGGAR